VQPKRKPELQWKRNARLGADRQPGFWLASLVNRRHFLPANLARRSRPIELIIPLMNPEHQFMSLFLISATSRPDMTGALSKRPGTPIALFARPGGQRNSTCDFILAPS